MLKVNLPLGKQTNHFVITFDGSIIELFVLTKGSSERLHIDQIKNPEIGTNKKDHHFLEIFSINGIRKMVIPETPDEKVSQLEELVNAINESKASL